MEYKAVFARFCILQGSFWAFQAAMMGYYTAYVIGRGMAPSVWGIILAANLLCSFLGSLFWGRWVDRKQAGKRYFLLGNASALLLGSALFFLADILPAVAVLYPLLGFMAGCIPTTLDAWVIASFPEQRDAVGRARSCATLSYAVVMLVTGQLIARLGYSVMPAATVLFLGISIATALFQPESRGSSGEAAQMPAAKPRQLLASRRYVLLVVSLFFAGMAIAPINSMKAVVLEHLGGDVTLLGWDSFIGCVIQAQFLIFSRYLLKIRAEKRLLLGMITPLLYALLVAAAQSPAMVILGTVMNNISFGVLYPTMREMTEECVNSALRNTAHSVVDVAYGSLSGMIATSWSGVVLENAGVGVLGFTSAAIQLIAIGCCVGMMLLKKAKTNKTCCTVSI